MRRQMGMRYVLIALMVLSIAATGGAGSRVSLIRVEINGVRIAMDQPPVVVGGRVLIPARQVAEALGARVAWDPARRLVTITGGAGPSGRLGAGTSAAIPPATASGSPPQDLGSLVRTVSGRVTVSLDATAYPTGKTMSVTVANGLDRTIYTLDEKTDCSIVFLQLWTGTAWQDLFACNLGRTPFVVAFGPGRGRAAVIRPMSGQWPGTDPSRPGFGSGQYRIKFTYRFTPPREGEPEPGVVYSASFRVY